MVENRPSNAVPSLRLLLMKSMFILTSDDRRKASKMLSRFGDSKAFGQVFHGVNGPYADI